MRVTIDKQKTTGLYSVSFNVMGKWKRLWNDFESYEAAENAVLEFFAGDVTIEEKQNEVLRNGAEVILRHEATVLCKWGREFATWQTDIAGNAYWGHYFGNKADALIDFIDRSMLAK